MDVALAPLPADCCPCESDFCLSGLPLTLCIRSLAVHLLHLWPERLPHAGRVPKIWLTLSEAAARIRSRAVTSVQLTEACLARIETYNPNAEYVETRGYCPADDRCKIVL